MISGTRFFIQQNNIYKNKKVKVTLAYSDEFLFYKLLDQNIEAGKTVSITFPNEKMTENSGLQKRLAHCANGKEFFSLMVDLSKTAIKAYLMFATRNVFALWKITRDMEKKGLYGAYNVEYEFDARAGSYAIVLEPEGEGNDSKGWMLLA